MNRIIAFVVTVSWALWFGGIVALFLFVTRLFKNGLGPDAAPVLFHAFEQYQIVIGCIALAATLLWVLLDRSRWKTSMLVLLLLAALAAGISTTLITPRIDAMRVEHQTKTDQFKRLHGRSMIVYSAQATLLLLAGTMLAMEYRPPRGRAGG